MALSDLQSCSIGGDSFQLLDWSMSSDPWFIEDGVPGGRKIQIQGEGQVEGADATAFASAVLATIAAFEASGVDVLIKGIGGKTEYQLLASQCVDGGPYVSVAVEKGQDGAAFYRKFRFTVDGKIGMGRSVGWPGGSSWDRQKVRSIVLPGGMRQNEVTGQVVGGRAQFAFDSAVLPDILVRYPAGNWVLRYSSEVNAAGDSLDYSVQAEQTLLGLVSLPGAAIVDGSASYTDGYDERGRGRQRWSYDLVIVGDAWAIVDLIRPKNVTIARSDVEYTYGKTATLKASWEVMVGVGDLLEWESTFEVQNEAGVVEPVQYDGVKSLLLAKRDLVYRIHLTGRAVGIGKFPEAPTDPVIPRYYTAEAPTITYARVSDVEYETRWSYAYVGLRPPTTEGVQRLVRATKRPANPTFIEVVG